MMFLLSYYGYSYSAFDLLKNKGLNMTTISYTGQTGIQ
jgi:hypothetical protein